MWRKASVSGEGTITPTTDTTYTCHIFKGKEKCHSFIVFSLLPVNLNNTLQPKPNTRAMDKKNVTKKGFMSEMSTLLKLTDTKNKNWAKFLCEEIKMRSTFLSNLHKPKKSWVDVGTTCNICNFLRFYYLCWTRVTELISENLCYKNFFSITFHRQVIKNLGENWISQKFKENSQRIGTIQNE